MIERMQAFIAERDEILRRAGDRTERGAAGAWNEAIAAIAAQDAAYPEERQVFALIEQARTKGIAEGIEIGRFLV